MGSSPTQQTENMAPVLTVICLRFPEAVSSTFKNYISRPAGSFLGRVKKADSSAKPKMYRREQARLERRSDVLREK